MGAALPEHERARFDGLVEEAIAALPPIISGRLEEIPVIVIDRPSVALAAEIGLGASELDELCGLHSGIMDTEASVEESGTPTSQVHLFRVGIIELAGGWDQPKADDLIYEQIMVTLLHEYGHQLGLDEDDLEDLGYA